MNNKVIFINNIKFNNIFSKLTVLQACSKVGLEIPRFCYHDKLSIAGNCRMCLVEIKNSPKPMASCALPVVDGMHIFTNSSVVKKAREGILEFLLANHPLDCPICDQGGECDLQDQSFIFGSDRGRFYEQKRAVVDKNCSPVIKTLMTRCIHCTRCIRFASEIAGNFSLGTTGRGSSMEVGTYFDNVFDSFLSGNVIDLCPVGALTSKPYSFNARPWDLDSVNSIDIFDSMHSNIIFNFKGYEVFRVLPRLNFFINDNWISDKVRFCYDGFKLQRLYYPSIKVNDNFLFRNCTWLEAFSFIKKKVNSNSNYFFKGFIGSLVDAEGIFSFKNFLNSMGSSSIYHESITCRSNIDFRSNFFFDFHKKDAVKSKTVVLFVGVNLSNELPLLKVKYKKLFLDNSDILFANIGNSFFDSNFMVKNLGNCSDIFLNIVEGTHWFCNYITQSTNFSIILGNSSIGRFDNNTFLSQVLYLNDFLKSSLNINVTINFLNTNSNSYTFFELGLQSSLSDFIYNSKNLDCFIFYYLIGINSNKNDIFFDKHSNNFLIFQGHHGNALTLKADVILPSSLFIEKEGTFINFMGFCQKSKQVFLPLYESRSDSSIFKSFSKVLGVSFKNNSLLLFSPIFSGTNSFKGYYKNNFILPFSGFFFKNTFFSLINNFFMDNSISNCSVNMSLCSKKFNKFNLNFK